MKLQNEAEKFGRINLIKINIKIVRLLVLILSFVSTIILLNACMKENFDANKKVIVLGLDGMDPSILKTLIQQGKVSHFAELAKSGCFHELGTSIPPQSPVAWSNFITGKNPGGHGIFDFIHRDPKTMEPYLSTSISIAPNDKISLGLFSIKNSFGIPFTKYHLPFSGGDIKLMRHGKAFWEYLDEAGIEASIIKVPSNYPPVKAGARSISGMGTPDILGTYGSFSYYTDNPPNQKQEISGGHIYTVEVTDNRVEAELHGPPNTFAEGSPELTIPFTVYLDTNNLDGKIVLPDKEIILNQGEWSDWVQLDFQPIPYIQSLNGICKFLLKEVYPDFKLYVTPINIDPSNPAMPISYPASYSKELYEKMGYFYTQGMAEDTKALSNGVLSNGEYLQQANFVFDERVKMLKIELERFVHMKKGMLFFYFSSLDQSSHVFWRTMDHASPAYNAARDSKYTSVMENIYEKMDNVLGYVISKISDDTTIIVMSDHGFSPFYRAFQLNTWLLNNGYLYLKNPSKMEQGGVFSKIDWTKTRAYGLGLNGLYINLYGREPHGIVTSGQERESLLDEIVFKLKQIKDPKYGKYVILDAFKTEDDYLGPYVKKAPDIIVGYNRGYRCGWESALLSFPKEVIKDNTNAWSGDHCVSPNVVPAIFLSNKKSKIINPKLEDLAPTILQEFGIKVPNNMNGRPVF